ncbi:hypothetical protein Taro_034516 [Colocasia esculenta]|uniref:1,4-alpha-glucan branching enzyme n=1 Tax=Colocasia esculenta TaxID=4460 RepID=A0A843VXZ4_COLES|nr:hypothetical protein [Colocasia esculenta]
MFASSSLLSLPRASPRHRVSRHGKASRQCGVVIPSSSAFLANSSSELSGCYSSKYHNNLPMWRKAEHHYAVSAVLKDNSMMTTIEDDADNLGICNVDPCLEEFKDHLRYRSNRYVEQKKLIEKYEGNLEDFAQAWIRYATVDPTKFAAAYDGVYWDPPPSERYQFKYARPPKPAAPRVYEAHVGMSGSEPRVTSYREFADDILPRIRANNYNTVQLMAVMEHSYYASFGYHVTNFFAVSSRSGTPEDLKYVIDKAHSLGLRVLMDVVHSHASNNVTDGLNGYDVGQSSQDSYFHTGDRGYHKLWDSRLFNYANWEVLRFLLSNLRWWLEEFKFDGFRFDGVTSMLYHHHGINMAFTGNYSEYFSEATDADAVVYMMLANRLVHSLLPDATVIAEDVSGMPTLCRPVSEGGVGFDHRLAMAIPDKWIDYLKNKTDDQWSMKEIVWSLTNRRYTEKCVSYAESHDQAIVGDKTIAFFLMDQEMYTGMSDLKPASSVIDRGIALHKMIHFITMALGGEGYLNFMGNEKGIEPTCMIWSNCFAILGLTYKLCLGIQSGLTSQEKAMAGVMISVAVSGSLLTQITSDTRSIQYMNAFDRAMNLLDEKFSFLSSTKQIVSNSSEEDKVQMKQISVELNFTLKDAPVLSIVIQSKALTLNFMVVEAKGVGVIYFPLQVIVFERGDLVFVFNFHPENTYEGHKVGCDLPGKYRVALDSDALEFGGHGRVGHDVDHFTSPEGIPGLRETNFNGRPNSFKVLSPPRTCVVYYKVEESPDDDDGELTGVDDNTEKAATEEITDATNLNVLVPTFLGELVAPDAIDANDMDDSFDAPSDD